MAAAGCRVIQVEEPRHHIAGADGTASDGDLEFFTDAVNREIKGVETEVWLHTCWGNPNQQPLHWERPSYERALPHLLQTNADVITAGVRVHRTAAICPSWASTAPTRRSPSAW